jgi:hypothetical protein
VKWMSLLLQYAPNVLKSIRFVPTGMKNCAYPAPYINLVPFGSDVTYRFNSSAELIVFVWSP